MVLGLIEASIMKGKHTAEACIYHGRTLEKGHKFSFLHSRYIDKVVLSVSMHRLISKRNILLHFLNLQDLIFLAYSLGSKYVG